MAKRGKKVAKVSAPTGRDLQDLRRLLRKAGGREVLIQWLDQCQGPKRGRRGYDPFEDFSISGAPVKGLYVMRWRMRGENCIAVVSPAKRWVRKLIEGGELKIATPHQTFLEIAKTHGGGHHSREAFAYKLAKKFGEKLREIKQSN